MKVTYTGTPEFPPVLRKKLETRMAKLGRLFDRNGDKEVHVVLTAQRHLQRAEITVNYYDHPLVGLESGSDALTAILAAADKLEKQILKLREKWRDGKRSPKNKEWNAAPVQAAAPPPKPARKKTVKPAEGRVFRVNSHDSRKPMTVDEAMLEMDSGDGYTVYRDAVTDKISVLVRRKDGHFDLIES